MIANPTLTSCPPFATFPCDSAQTAAAGPVTRLLSAFAIRLLFVCLATATAACGTSPGTEVVDDSGGAPDSQTIDVVDSGAVDVASTPDAEVTTPVGEPCETDEDCPGGWCIGPSGCDAEWTCVSEVPCSAAPPISVCACGGLWTEVNAGCPGERYAFIDSQLPDRFLGTACEPTLPPPERIDLVVTGSEFSELNGVTLAAVLVDNVIGRSEPVQLTQVANGQFEFRWFSSFDLNTFGYFVRAWVDDGNGRCDADENVFEWFASNTFSGESPLVVPVTPAESSPSTCP